MTFTLPIERGKIREFARAAHSQDSAYDRVDAVVPPTFLTVARQFWEPIAESPIAATGFDLRRLLHGEEEFVFHGPPVHAGQTLTADSRLESTSEKEGKRGGRMRLATFVTEFRDETGLLVAEQRTTLLETGKAERV